VADQVDALCIGETMVALRSRGLLSLGAPLTPAIAGAESNVAIALSRLGHHAAWCGLVGADQAGALVLRTLRAEGVDLRCVRREPAAATGLMVREERLPGVVRVDYHRRGSAGSRLDLTDVDRALRTLQPRVVHVTGISLAISQQARAAVIGAVRAARELGATVSLDVNHRRRLWTDGEASAALAPLLPDIDILVGSVDELALLALSTLEDGSDAAAELLTLGPAEVVVKRGAHGASAFTLGESHHLPAHQITLVDPVGAGDAFTAGYLSGRLDGLPVREALARANLLGGFAAASDGDWEGLPTREEFALLALADGEAVR